MPPSASALAAFGLRPAPKPLRLVRRPRLTISFTPENPFENAQVRTVFTHACEAGLLEALFERYPFCMEGGARAILLELPPEQVADPNRAEFLEHFEAELEVLSEKATWFVAWVDPFICLLEAGESEDPQVAVNEAFHQLKPLSLHAGRLEMTYELPRRRSRVYRRPAATKPLQQV